MIRYFKGRFKILLIFLLMLAIIDPMLKGYRTLGYGFIDIIFTVILLSAVYSVSSNKKALIGSIIVVVPIFVISWAGLTDIYPWLNLVNYGLGIVFFLLVAIFTLIYILKEEYVTMELVYGSACVYLIMGIIWAIVYALIELINPGSFSFGDMQGPSQTADQYSFLDDMLTYYSYITLTTLGYGDVTPLSAPARSFSALEAVVGQLYIVLLVARLVGLQISQSIQKKQKYPSSENHGRAAK